MSILVKICGLNSLDAVRAAATADFAGFIFYPPSPRYIEPETAAALAAKLPKPVKRVAGVGDPDDAAVRRRFGRRVIKALPVSAAGDLKAASTYADSADWLMFDAKPPKRKGALPGGNAESFDWRLLGGKSFARPWLLSGGLDATNVAKAVRVAAATAVDVSSGVEDRPGHKNVFKIREFIKAARSL